MRRSSRPGVTLIELLVVISIIGVLMALALPAVQASRETARRAECANHLRQLALACASHESAHRHFPTGGWGWQWMGDPDRGFDRRQPGGWPYQVLPYLEHGKLREMGKGLLEVPKRAAVRTMAAISLPVFHCPSRRAALAYPYIHPKEFHNIDRPEVLARSDYAACAGDQTPELYGPGPESLKEGDSPSYKWPKEEFTGVVFRRSELRASAIRDGLSNVYLLGEGYMNPNHYETGEAKNDDQGLYVGFDRDTLRVSSFDYPPLADRAGLSSDHSFGSAHAAGWHAAFCDGTVRMLPYVLDAEVHRRLGNRKDGQPTAF